MEWHTLEQWRLGWHSLVIGRMDGYSVVRCIMVRRSLEWNVVEWYVVDRGTLVRHLMVRHLMVGHFVVGHVMVRHFMEPCGMGRRPLELRWLELIQEADTQEPDDGRYSHR